MARAVPKELKVTPELKAILALSALRGRPDLGACRARRALPELMVVSAQPVLRERRV
jgi:hypothetical protein